MNSIFCHLSMTILPPPLLKLVLHWSFHVIFDEDHDKNVRKFPSYFYPAFAQIKFFPIGKRSPDSEIWHQLGQWSQLSMSTPLGSIRPSNSKGLINIQVVKCGPLRSQRVDEWWITSVTKLHISCTVNSATKQTVFQCIKHSFQNAILLFFDCVLFIMHI